MNRPDRAAIPPRRRAVAAAGLVTLLGLSGFGLSRAMSTGAGETCVDVSPVTVSTTPEFYEIVARAAARVEARGRDCASFDVRQEASGQVAQALGQGQAPPQVWIPDSKAWPRSIADRPGVSRLTVGQVLATSPVVLAVPPSLVGDRRLERADSWSTAMIDGTVPLASADPASSTPTLLSVVASYQQVPAAKRQDLLQSIMRLSRNTSTVETLFQRSAQGAKVAGVFPTSEQLLYVHNQENPAAKVSALVPREGAPDLEYTWVTQAGPAGPSAAAIEALRAELASAESARAMQNGGFRAPGHPVPGGTGLTASLALLPTPDGKTLHNALSTWTNLSLDTRMLVLLDASGSMAQPAGDGQTRLSLLQRFGQQALRALPPTSKLGVWAFSTGLAPDGKDYVRLTPEVRVLSETAHLRTLQQALTTQMPTLVARGGDTGLYDSIADAFAYTNATYDERYVNSVVVLTDGRNDDPKGGLSLQQLVARVKALYDPQRPVKIVTVGIGTDVDAKALQQITAATGGLSYVATDPRDITSVFVDAFLRRGSA